MGGVFWYFDIVEEDAGLRERLQENTDFLHSELRSLGFDLGSSQTQIIPIMTGKTSTALAMAADLMNQGIFLLAIRPPTVPTNAARLRLTVTALHTLQELERVVAALKKTGRTHTLIN